MDSKCSKDVSEKKAYCDYLHSLDLCCSHAPIASAVRRLSWPWPRPVNSTNHHSSEKCYVIRVNFSIFKGEKLKCFQKRYIKNYCIIFLVIIHLSPKEGSSIRILRFDNVHIINQIEIQKHLFAFFMSWVIFILEVISFIVSKSKMRIAACHGVKCGVSMRIWWWTKWWLMRLFFICSVKNESQYNFETYIFTKFYFLSSDSGDSDDCCGLRSVSGHWVDKMFRQLISIQFCRLQWPEWPIYISERIEHLMFCIVKY